MDIFLQVLNILICSFCVCAEWFSRSFKSLGFNRKGYQIFKRCSKKPVINLKKNSGRFFVRPKTKGTFTTKNMFLLVTHSLVGRLTCE
jgi:hypothetical protein